MRRLRFLAAVIGSAMLALVPVAPAANGSDLSPSIIDGGLAPSGPWAARLFVNNQEHCTSTIIAARWILTAKHCVAAAGTYTFHIGNVDQTAGAFAQGVGIYRHSTA